MRNAFFCSSRPPILALKIHAKIMFFQDAFLDTLFVSFMLILYKNNRFWDRFKIQWAPKIDFQIDQVAPKTLFFQFRAVDFPQSSFFYIVVAFWLSVGTLLVPIGYLLLHFRFIFNDLLCF